MPLNHRPFILGDTPLPRRRELCDDITKTLYDGPDPGTHVLYFKDDTCLKQGIDKTQATHSCNDAIIISGKGVINNRISELLMSRLNELGIDTHFVRTLNMREQLVQSTEGLPFKITMHNVAAGSFAARLGIEEGMPLSKPIPEFTLKSDPLNHPIVATEHLISLGWSRIDEIEDILLTMQRVNDFLNGQFLALNIRLISFTLEFGRIYISEFMDSQLLITDELSPDTCHLMDLNTGQRLDRQGVYDAPEYGSTIYQEVARRLGVLEIGGFESSSLKPCKGTFHSQDSVTQEVHINGQAVVQTTPDTEDPSLSHPILSTLS